MKDTSLKNKELEHKSCADIIETKNLRSTSSVFFPNVQVCNENEEEVDPHDATMHVNRSEKVSIHPIQLYATQNMSHNEESGKISEVSYMILALQKSMKGIEIGLDLNLQNIMMRNYDEPHVSNEIDYDSCTDLVMSHDDTFAEILQLANQSSVLNDLFYDLIWFIYVILYTYISDTLHVNKFGNLELDTHDITAIQHSQNLCANLTESHVDTSNEFYFDKKLVLTCSINSPKNFPSCFETFEFDMVCNMNGKNVSVLSFDMYDLVKMKYDNMNQMIGLKEIFVLPSSKLFASWPTLRECFKCGKGNNWTINYNGTSGQNKMKDYCNYRVHPPSVLSRLFPGKQKSGTTFLQGREDDVTMPRQSTFTMWSRQLFKVKAKLSSQLFRFPLTRLLLGLYNYRFKHIAVMEEEYHDIITTLQVIRLLQLFGNKS
jgi:hypothetical protein